MSALDKDKLSATERELMLNSLPAEEVEREAELIIQARRVEKEISEDAMLDPIFRAILASDLIPESEKAVAFSFCGTILHDRDRDTVMVESTRVLEAELRRGYILDGMLRQAVAGIERLAKTV